MKHLIMAGAIALMGNLPSIANAQEHDVSTTIVASEATIDASAQEDRESPFGTKAIGDGKLRTVAGREDTTQVSKAQQNAAVTRNSVGDNTTTGTAEISGNAFQNMSGLSILNVNTGNNVAINASMNVNISISPLP